MERYTLDLIQAFAEIYPYELIVFTKKIDSSLKLPSTVTPILVSTKFIPRILQDRFFSYRVKKLKDLYSIDIVIGCCRNIGSDIICCGGTHSGFTSNKKSLSFYDQECIRVEKEQYEKASFVVAHSNRVGLEVENFYSFTKNKIKTIYPPINESTFKKIATVERKKLKKFFGFKDEFINFVFVSSSHQRKGFDLLSSFFKKTKLPVKLYVVGRPLPKGLSYKNIEYLGYQKNIAEIYGASDYSILASNYEPFGLAPVEAVSCGTPVVISDALGAGEIIKDTAKFVFKSQDEASLEIAMENAVKSFPNLQSLLEKESGLTVKNLSPKHHAEQILSIAKSIYSFKDSSKSK